VESTGVESEPAAALQKDVVIVRTCLRQAGMGSSSAGPLREETALKIVVDLYPNRRNFETRKS
jgi:hypothetical protein